MSLVHEILTVLTDTMHKPGFKMQAAILRHCMQAVAGGSIVAPVFDTTQASYSSNVEYVGYTLSTKLSQGFPNLSGEVVTVRASVVRPPCDVRQGFVSGLFDLQKDDAAFKAHVRDFLIQVSDARVRKLTPGS